MTFQDLGGPPIPSRQAHGGRPVSSQHLHEDPGQQGDREAGGGGGGRAIRFSKILASKKAQEKYQIPKLKTVWTQNGLFYYQKILILGKLWHFYYIKLPSLRPESSYFLDLILLPGLFRFKLG